MSLALAPTKKKVIVPYHGQVAVSFPNAETVAKGAHRYLVLDHGTVETVVLRSIGLNCPAPISVQYDWNKIEPFKSQRKGAELMTMHNRGYNFSGMGTGKTLTTLFAYDFLQKTEGLKHMLVVAPLSTLSTVWHREISTYMPHMRVQVLYGDAEKRRKLLATPADVYIINYDAIHIILKAKDKPKFNMVVLDEADAYRNASTDRWKFARALIHNVPRVFALTGTPTPNAPTDAHGLARLITPSRVPRSFVKFRNQTMNKYTMFRWVPNQFATDIVNKALQPSVRFTIDDDSMPPLIQETRQATLSPTQQRVYKTMMNQLKMDYAHGTVVAANAADKQNKLIQTACGFMYDTKKETVVAMDYGDRYQIISDVVSQAEKKALVFCPFKAMVTLVADKLKQDGFDVATVTGDTKKEDRDKIFSNFSYTKRLDVIVAHPGTMSHGLNLVAANVVVWAAPAPSLLRYLQANARVRRPGQTVRQFVIHIEGCALERRAYTKLANKEQIQNLLLDMLEKGEDL